MRQARQEAARKRQVDVRAMRQAAQEFLGWLVLDTKTAADMININERTWRRFERREKFIADGQIRLFWYEVALTKLEELEKNEGQEAVNNELGGQLTVARVFDYVYAAWEQWDPLQRKD